MLTVGAKAPDFSLIGDDGAYHSLGDHQGVPVVVYFYPKDDTPGCTTEACDFRDNMEALRVKGAVVFGISKDNTSSHVKFKEKYAINFSLLSDPDLKVHAAYGAENAGRGIRSTFLIDDKGNIAKFWSPVKVPGHVQEVMKALDGLEYGGYDKDWTASQDSE